MSSRARTILIVAVVAFVVLVAAVAAIAATGGDDGDSTPATTVLPNDLGTVTVEGDAVPAPEGSTDPAIGAPVPTITGTDYQGNPVTIAPGEDGPMLIVVMAHWCPHCNAEVPLLVDWQESGDVPEGLRVVGVSTSVNPDRDHFPPSEWLSEDMGWTWPVLADDGELTAAAALGTTGYPYLLFVDADGNVLLRGSGEIPLEAIQDAAEQTVRTAQSGTD